MPSTDKTVKSELTGTVDRLLNEKRSSRDDGGGEVEFLNIIEFVERFKLLPDGLYPVQRFILKLYYNIPLDDFLPEIEKERIRITDRFGIKILQELSEVQYLKFLFSQGRCNIEVQGGKDRRELILVLGRRSGKSLLSAIISAYELYKLLRRTNPQSYYGMPSGSEIRIICVANDKEQASIVYQEMASYTTQVDYFKSSIVHDTQIFQRFQTDHDRQRLGPDSNKGTITATFKSSVAKGLRGRGIICMVLDELAFFIDDGRSSAERVYKALTPSTAQFSPRDPKNRHKSIAPTEGKIISISSPDAKDGFFYRLYQMALANNKASSNMLMIQAPTWEVNPTFNKEYYEVEYAKDPKSFDTEHGAQFSDRVRGWIEDYRDLIDCVLPDLRPYNRGGTREPHWAGVDFGLSRDGTSVSLTHIKEGRIELAYHESWYAGRKWKEVNPHLLSPLVDYANLLQDVKRLDIDEIANWLFALSRRFYIMKGVFDQWAGPIFEQKLHKVGLMQFEMKSFSSMDSSQCYQSAKMLMYARQLAIYDYPVPATLVTDLGQGKHSPHITELLELQSSSGGKNITLVEAPNVPGKHDDFSDSLVRSCSLAMEYIRENPKALEGLTGLTLPANSSVPGYGYAQFHRSRMRMHGPPPAERMVPRLFRRR